MDCSVLCRPLHIVVKIQSKLIQALLEFRRSLRLLELLVLAWYFEALKVLWRLVASFCQIDSQYFPLIEYFPLQSRYFGEFIILKSRTCINKKYWILFQAILNLFFNSMYTSSLSLIWGNPTSTCLFSNFSYFS